MFICDSVSEISLNSINMVVKSTVSGISTDVVLFSELVVQLVHHYQVFRDCGAEWSPVGTSKAVSVGQYSAGTGDVPSVVRSAAYVSIGVDLAAATALRHCYRMSHWIPHCHSRSRSGRARRRPGPGRQPLSLIWLNLIWHVLALLCPDPRCLTL